MAKFLPLKSLAEIIKNAKFDLGQLRDINAKLAAKITTVSSRSQFKDEYVQREAGKLREDAISVAKAYVRDERTFELLASVAAQDEYWTLEEYLARAGSVTDVGLTADNTVGHLLRKTNLLLAMPRMLTSAIAAVARTAQERDDWATLGLIYNECQFRGQGDDSPARAIVVDLQGATVPDIDEAQKLIAEAKQLEEWIGYTLRAIANNEEDIGLRYEGYARLSAERELAKSQNLKPAA